VFTLRRGGLLIAVNFGTRRATLPESGALLFTTPTAAALDGSGLTLPPHAGVLLRRT
jgi:maltooligosyltrehalose trehalohydrolase